MADKKRRVIELLPVALQTETLTKFFAATLDHLLQPESVEFLSGYIGSKPSYYNPSKDYYVSEPTKTRRDYQLPVTAITSDQTSGQTKNIMFYDDMINMLKFHGANVDSHSRLFEQEYYSWAPPVNLDKLINYTKYVWVSTGVSTIYLLDATDVVNGIFGKEQFTYNGAYKLDSTDEILVGPLKFTNDMSVTFTKDVTSDFNDVKFFVGGVGNGIVCYTEDAILLPGFQEVGWDIQGWGGQPVNNVKNYFTIAKYSSDKNQWSLANKWVHEDLVALSKTNVPDLASMKALRPIVEIKPNMLIWDYGWYGRQSVDLVITDIIDVLPEIVGKSSYIYDDVPLNDGMRLLVISDQDPTVNNRIYTVGGILDSNAISLTLSTDGQDPTGAPTLGDRCFVNLGTYSGLNFWYGTGATWAMGQQYQEYVAPVFSLFDTDGNSLADPSVYQGSDFSGNQIFGYTQDSESPYDSELGTNPKRDQFGSFVFTDYLSTDTVSYLVNNSKTDYVGYQFYQIRDTAPNGGFQYGNSWHKSQTNSKQYIVNDYLSVSVPNLVEPIYLEIDQLPADDVPGLLPNIQVFRIRDQGQSKLLNGVDYTTRLNPITNMPQLAITPGAVLNGDRVIVKTWNKGAPHRLTGYYELPLNLTANPNNKDITTISQSQLLDQFSQIMENQIGFDGNPLGTNNYRDTPGDLSLGLSILQHRAPMLKLMMLNSGDVLNGVMSAQSKTDPMLAMQFGQREYIRFYNRFVKTLFNLYRNGYGLEQPPSDWLTSALKQINIGKTQSNPWANSGYDTVVGGYCSQKSSNPTFIPPTAARLGITPCYRPVVYYQGLQLVLQTHDGSRLILEDQDGRPLGSILNNAVETSNPDLLSHPVAKAWLQLELNIYENIPSIYSDKQADLVFDVRTYVPGKWRDTEYTRDEYLAITQPMFDKWVIVNQVDYRPNTTFNIDDQFTFNYSNMIDKQGKSVPGNWRGMYRWYYDTDRPNTHPWEMLGFSQMPDWWYSEYGPAPYTSGNTRMWEDLRDGVIKHGPLAGTHPAWARPGLMSCIPVDQQGELLPPLLAGIVTGLPSLEQAKAEWVFGDGSPIESVWVHSQDYSFSMAQASYLMKPAQFIEYCWDTPRTKHIYEDTDADQWIYIDTNSRRGNSQFYVHRENPITVGGNMHIPNESNLSYFGSCGCQHWISEYLVSQSLDVTNYFGSLIRGSCSRLAHKVGAYINSSDTSLRLTADSFGTIGYRSQMVPSENVNTYLYRSASIGTSFYGGVIVKQVSKGWQVFGYDGVNPKFNIIPSNITGPKTYQVIGNQRMTTYSTGQRSGGQPVVKTVPYGQIFGSRQDVYDFIISYGRWLESEGWVFDTYSDQSNTMIDWLQSAKEFVYWSQANWANGNFIALSPLANSAKFAKEFGNIEFVNGLISGTYPVLDRSGSPIDAANLEILRYDDNIVVRPLNEQSLYALRLFRTTLEHVIVLDNTTAFGDVIYDDMFNISQPRLKMYAYRTNDWSGRLDAPGYFLYQNSSDNTWTMIPNFEKTSDDIRKYFNIEQPKNFDEIDPATNVSSMKTSQNSVIDRSDIADLAKHMFGYQERNYLNNLLLEDSTEFQFYQGFVRQKGTSTTIDKILRNTSVVDVNESFEYYEEYGLRAGRYGSVALNTTIEFILPQTQFINSPQQINVFGTLSSNREADGIIEFIPNDPRFLVGPTNWNTDRFPLRTTLGQNFKTDLPTAGYVKLGETDWYVTNTSVLTSLYSTMVDTTRPLQNRDTIWQFIENDTGWTVWQYTKSPAAVVTTTPSNSTGQPTTINCDGQHGLSDGDLVTLVGIANVDVLNNTWTVQNVNTYGNTFQVPQNTFSVGYGGDVYAYKKVRYGNVYLRDQDPPVGGWVDGDMAWVDSGDVVVNGWTVYKMIDGAWLSARVENHKVDASLMIDSNLYSIKNASMLTNLTYYDPAKGFIPGQADANLDIKSLYDPARYNQGDDTVYEMVDDAAWELAQVGVTWWDLSTVRYIDYEISEDSYRWKNWGKIAPGTTVDVYEWVRSPVPPTSWDSYVAQSQSFSQYGVDYTPSGKVKNSSNPAWTETMEYDANGNGKTWYYFWVTNATTLPVPQGRTLTTLEISNLLSNPNGYGISWYAAMSTNSVLVANVSRYLNSDNTAMQMMYTQKQNDALDHKQWELVREGDRFSTISSYFWDKMHDSLIGYDALGFDIPDPNLNESQKYGTLIRPRQSWFKDRSKAGQIYVNKVNYLLANSVIPLRDDPDSTSWIEYFFDEEPIPPQEGNWDYMVSSLAERDSISGQLNDGQKVLVTATIDTGYLWTIYQWNYFTRTYTRVRVQAWKTQNYWDYVDWYSPNSGVTSTTIPDYTVDTQSQLDTVTLVDGLVVKVRNNGNNLWEIYKYNAGQWERVALEAGTVEISSSVYDGSGNVIVFDEDGYDSSPYDMNPFKEFSNIINGVRYSIFGSNSNSNTIELNTIFFSVLNYVLSEQGFVDWIIKTSHIILKGFNQPLYTGDLYQSDNIDSLLDYINEIRPYHSKVREFISGRTTFDESYVNITDFDKPVYDGRVLNPSDPVDVGIMINDPVLKRWYENYQKNPDLIRTMKTTLVFDRIYSVRKIGWNSSRWNDRPWSYDLGPGDGAFYRIQKYYKPTADMIPADSDQLIGGTAYKGVMLSGMGFEVNLGWDMAPWDFAIGWNATEMDFDGYIDLMIQGGAVPQYESFYGDNQRKAFKLSKIPQDVQHTAVWSDNTLRTYGVDWIIPNWMINASIVIAGVGYEIGEILVADTPNAVDDARFIVTQVDNNGAILGIQLERRGSYDLVVHNSISLSYRKYHEGSGTGAMIQAVWGGDTLVFNEAPGFSEKPSVYILFAGDTFDPAPDGEFDIINDGNGFVQPYVEEDHAEELYKSRLNESIRLDVYSMQSGGKPVIYVRSYQTNGKIDQFDLNIKPQTENSVIVTFNGAILKYGIENDYVINFYTNKLVFMTPPATGVIRVTTIGTGGAGSSIVSAYVATPGAGYNTGDMAELIGGAGNNATVMVASTQAVSAVVTNGGSGYRVGDTLLMEEDITVVSTSRLSLVVTGTIELTGEITSVSINTPGDYKYRPTIPVWITNNDGVGANISVTWGAASLLVYNQGFYFSKPTDSYLTSSILPATGTGLTVNANYGITKGTDVFKAQPGQIVFALSFDVAGADQLLVTVNGTVVDLGNLILDGRNLTVLYPISENDVVIATGFNTSTFSIVREQEITIDSGIYSYPLQYVEDSGKPPYSSTMVMRNNVVMRPPPMNSYIADGLSTIYDVTYIPPYGVGMYVYVDSKLMENGTDYSTSGNTVVFNEAPTEGAFVVAVVLNTSYGYDYYFDSFSINFPSSLPADWTSGYSPAYGTVGPSDLVAPGDTIRVITFTEDYTYKWMTELFVSDGASTEYQLQARDLDRNSLMVIVAGQIKDLITDYLVIENELGYVVSFNTSSLPLTNSSVVVRYATGLDSKPPIAWRTLIGDDGVSNSTAIDDSRKTTLLSDVFVYSSDIAIEDLRKVSVATDDSPGYVWIGNELISYTEVTPTPTLQYPNKGLLSGLRRGVDGTSGIPTAGYNALFYSGDGVTRYFATGSGTTPDVEVIYVDGLAQVSKSVDPDVGTYDIAINPAGYPAGRYVVFDSTNTPKIGLKNVKISYMYRDSSVQNPVHPINSEVIDAGTYVDIPGGYVWSPAPNGLQYENTLLSKFLRSHSGTRN